MPSFHARGRVSESSSRRLCSAANNLATLAVRIRLDVEARKGGQLGERLLGLRCLPVAVRQRCAARHAHFVRLGAIVHIADSLTTLQRGSVLMAESNCDAVELVGRVLANDFGRRDRHC